MASLKGLALLVSAFGAGCFWMMQPNLVSRQAPDVPFPYPPELNYSTATPANIVRTCQTLLNLHEVSGETVPHWPKKPDDIRPSPENERSYHFHFYRPSLIKYGASQWLWDDGAHMITWSHLNLTNSVAALRTMLKMQLNNGMIPEVINWLYQPQRLVQQNRSSTDSITDFLEYSSPFYTDLTQMPVLPFSLRAMHEQVPEDLDLLQEFVPSLVRYFDWWADTRDVDGNGLVSIIHGWESGLDASPIYDIPYVGEALVNRIRREGRQIRLLELYPHFISILAGYKWWYRWDQQRIIQMDKGLFGAPYFLVQDVGVNSVYAAGWGVLADLASKFNATMADHCRERQATAQQAILRHLWDPNLGRFVSSYKDAQKRTRALTTEVVQSLFPLLLGDALPPDVAEKIVTQQLLNPDKFWTAFPVPTVARSEPSYAPVFRERLMWRGPSWGFTNWFIMEGLMRCRREDVARQLLDRWVAAYQKSGIYEHWNPETAEPYGSFGLGMSTLITDWLFRLGVVEGPRMVQVKRT